MKDELIEKDAKFCFNLDMIYVKLVNWIVKMNSDSMVDPKLPSRDS